MITLFSGDAFNPSLESSVTKGMVGPVLLERLLWAWLTEAGRHMVPVLNMVGADVACVGVRWQAHGV